MGMVLDDEVKDMAHAGIQGRGQNESSRCSWHSDQKGLHENSDCQIATAEAKGAQHTKLEGLQLNVRHHERIDKLRAQDGQKGNDRDDIGCQEYSNGRHLIKLGLDRYLHCDV